MTTPIYFDRTRAENWQHCPRKRYWSHEYQGQGIERIVQSVPLLTGSLVHKPLGIVLTDPSRLEYALLDARKEYQEVVIKQGVLMDSFDGSESDYGKVVKAIEWQIDEQLAILEALVRGWAKLRLPALLAEFDVLSVEQEEQYRFPTVRSFKNGLREWWLATDLVLLARSDAVLRRKGSREVFVLNFKTTSDPNITWQQQWAYDQQTISEVLAVEQRLNERVSGVLIEGLVKGRRNIQHPKDSGQWRHNSPLIYGWKRDGLPAPEYEARYEYKDDFGVTRRLGKGFQRFFVPDEMPIPAWIEQLERDCPSVLRAQFVNLPAILRSDYAVERWRKGTQATELHIRACREAAKGMVMELDEAFPMHTGHGNCLRPSRCDFFDVCHGMQDPDDLSVYRKRVPNHPEPQWRTTK